MTISESPHAPTPGSGPGSSDVFTGPVVGAVTSAPARDAAGAYQTVAWRAPSPTRFDGRPANDFLVRAEAVAPLRVWRAPDPAPTPAPMRAGWLTLVVGAGLAAGLGALVGGLMSV